MFVSQTHCFSPNQRRPAFTLVELLVVIAIIGILVGLLLPAVQAAREAARRASCMNNLTQLGLAVHHHEFSVERLPSGVINPEGPIRSEANGQHVSWTVQILPFVEQQNVYEHFDIDAGSYASVNEKAVDSQIPTYHCSSNPSAFSMQSGQDRTAISNYAACHNDSESPINEDNNGLMFLNSRIRYRDILDGSSQTILLGEVLPHTDDLNWASGTRATLRNTSGFDKRTEWMKPDPRGPLQVGGFGSFHTGGGNFAFADGSIRFLTTSINPDLFRQLGNRADGELLVEAIDY